MVSNMFSELVFVASIVVDAIIAIVTFGKPKCKLIHETTHWLNVSLSLNNWTQAVIKIAHQVVAMQSLFWTWQMRLLLNQPLLDDAELIIFCG